MGTPWSELSFLPVWRVLLGHAISVCSLQVAGTTEVNCRPLLIFRHYSRVRMLAVAHNSEQRQNHGHQNALLDADEYHDRSRGHGQREFAEGFHGGCLAVVANQRGFVCSAAGVS